MQMWTNIPKMENLTLSVIQPVENQVRVIEESHWRKKFTKEMLTSHKEEYGMNLHGKKYLPIVWTVS